MGLNKGEQMSIKLKRLFDKPIITSSKSIYWEAAGCYNAGAIMEDGKIHLYYRGADACANGRECEHYNSYIGHAVSNNGIDFIKDKGYILGPVEASQEERGCEDPRITKVGDRYYMLYTGYGARYEGDYRICMAVSDDLITWSREGVLLNETNKDAALFPEKINGNYVLLHRRAPNIWLSYSRDLKEWNNHKILAKINKEHDWEDAKIGIAGPPIKTDKGYILIYHGVSEKTTYFKQRGDYQQYALGIMLLDLEDPSKVIYRQEEPILIPELIWEKEVGNVPNVVFSCGQVIIDDQLYVYYAGADTAMGVATCDLSEIMTLFNQQNE